MNTQSDNAKTQPIPIPINKAGLVWNKIYELDTIYERLRSLSASISNVDLDPLEIG